MSKKGKGGEKSDQILGRKRKKEGKEVTGNHRYASVDKLNLLPSKGMPGVLGRADYMGRCVKEEIKGRKGGEENSKYRPN